MVITSTPLPATHWKLCLFGEFRLVGGGDWIFETRGKRHKLLLALVALQENCEMSRTRLASNLFDEEELPSSQNLRLLVSRLGSALRDHSDARVFKADQDRIRLDLENVEVDVVEFLRLMSEGDRELDESKRAFMLARALEMWSGDVVPELDHPAITPIRERLRQRALKALLDLARSPVAGDYLDLLDAKLPRLEALSREEPSLIGNVMRVLSALGRKERLIQVFADFEAWFDDEYGEAPNPDLCGLFERLANEAGSSKLGARPFAPLRPDITVGRVDLLQELSRFAAGESKSGLLTLVGLSGIGKSHLLAEAYWRADATTSVQWIDFGASPERAIVDRLLERPTSCLFVDHADHISRDLLEGLAKRFPDLRIVLASHHRTGLQGERVLLVPPLEIGSPSRSGASMELLRHHAEHHLAASLLPEAFDDRRLYEIASLCDGIPLALELAGMFMASAGTQATHQALSMNSMGRGAWESAAVRHQSVGHAIQVSFDRLSSGAKKLVVGLSHCQTRCHAGLALWAFKCETAELQEAFLSGLMRRHEDAPIFQVPDSISHYIRSTEPSAAVAGQSLTWAKEVADWFEIQSLNLPVDLGLASSLGMAFWSAGVLHECEDVEYALRILSVLKPWLGSESASNHDMTLARKVICDEYGLRSPYWPKATLALAALCFHLGEYAEMDALLSGSMADRGFREAELSARSHRKMQMGLARRALGDFDQACRLYREAISIASEAGSQQLVVLGSFNLATLLETLERYEEALRLYADATDAFGADTDVRIENLVNSSIARLQHILGGDLVEVCRIYEATLMHAMERDDRHISAVILQNLGAAYASAGSHLKAGRSIVIGTALLLDFGYTEEFRRLARSAFAVLGYCLRQIGEQDLMYSVRVMIDRLGRTPIYVTAAGFHEELEKATYRSPERLRHGTASEEEVSSLLRQCYGCLTEARIADEAPLIIEVSERFAQPRLLG